MQSLTLLIVLVRYGLFENSGVCCCLDVGAEIWLELAVLDRSQSYNF